MSKTDKKTPIEREPAHMRKKPPFKLDVKIMGRIFGYMKPFKAQLILVAICIVVSSIASVAASLFIKTLIDDYIMPLIGVENPDFSGLLSAIIGMIALFLVGIVCTLGYNRLMANVSQGVLKNIRDEMFGHMQSLPIKYFDTHTHGDVMSYYTNDTDALRQMISQTLPQVLASLVTIVSVFASMLSISIWLTLIVVAFLGVMFFTTGKIA